MQIIDRYLLREIVLPLAIGIGLFFVVVAFGQVLQISDSVTGLGVSGSEILQALLFSIPPLMGLLLPAGCLFATLLAIGRMASDREIIAMSASGISPYRLLRVPIWLGIIFAICASFFMIKGEPWGIRGLRDLMSRSAQRALAQGVRHGEFQQWIPGVTFLTKNKNNDDLDEVIFIDRREAAHPIVISARHGKILSGDHARDLVFALDDGVVIVEDKESNKYRVIKFARSHYRLDVGQMVTNKARTLQAVQEKDITSLWVDAHDHSFKPGKRALFLIIFNRKVALPLATIIFSLLAVTLAARTGGGARARGFLYSAGIIGSYYYIGRAAELSARAGHLDPFFAAWIPNIIGAIALIIMLVRFKRRAV
ncbi:MAG: LptF/LptG family permease [Deltaproteobacteria bacterium]|nr:LptF/LptG family permease [Deltaproteobacteria bacterium]